MDWNDENLPTSETPEWWHATISFPGGTGIDAKAATALGERLAGQRWHFLRKEGKLRLRTVHPADEILDNLVADQLAALWVGGVYEPETEAFGGPAGMVLAHDLFCADSPRALAETGDPRARERCVLLLSTMYRAAGLDPFEIGDVWARLAALRPQIDPPDPAGRRLAQARRAAARHRGQKASPRPAGDRTGKDLHRGGLVVVQFPRGAQQATYRISGWFGAQRQHVGAAQPQHTSLRQQPPFARARGGVGGGQRVDGGAQGGGAGAGPRGLHRPLHQTRRHRTRNPQAKRGARPVSDDFEGEIGLAVPQPGPEGAEQPAHLRPEHPCRVGVDLGRHEDLHGAGVGDQRGVPRGPQTPPGQHRGDGDHGQRHTGGQPPHGEQTRHGVPESGRTGQPPHRRPRRGRWRGRGVWGQVRRHRRFP